MIVIDIETTGLNPERHSIVSLGALDFHNPKNQFYKECRIWEGAEINPFALEINGFSEQAIKDPKKISLEQLIRSFILWAEKFPLGHDLTLAGENPRFDYDFLRISAERYDLKFPFSHRTVDLHTLTYALLFKMGLPLEFDGKGCSGMCLNKTLGFVGLPKEPEPHNALTGAKYEAEAFSRLLFGRPLLEEFSKFQIPAYLKNDNL